MEKGDKGSTLTRMGVSGWMFLLVPAYLGCPGQTAVKWLLLLLSESQEDVTLSSVNCDHYCLYLSHNLIVFSRCVDFFYFDSLLPFSILYYLSCSVWKLLFDVDRYYKRICIPDMDRFQLTFNPSSLQFSHANSTLIIKVVFNICLAALHWTLAAL